MTYSKRAKSELPALVFATFSALFPVIAVISVHTVGPIPVVVALCGMVLLRVVIPGSRPVPGYMTLALLTAAAAVAAIATMDGDLSVRLYPVFMNAAMLAAFAGTLVYPPSMIERFARITKPDLPPKAVAYARKVTMVWAGFFLVNGAIALWTAVSGSWTIWTIYNGGIAYALMGALFLMEYCGRRRFVGRKA